MCVHRIVRGVRCAHWRWLKMCISKVRYRGNQREIQLLTGVPCEGSALTFQDVPWPGEQEGDDVEGTDAGALRVASRDGQRALRWLARWVQTEAHGPVEYFLSWSHLWRHMPVEETATQQQHTGRSMKE